MSALVLACLLLAPPQQPRDAVQPSTQAGASIAGRIVAQDGTTPLRRAIVRVSGPAIPRRLTVRADQSGRYAFGDLPPGRYTLTAAKAGHLTLEYGQRRPFEAGRRIELGARQQLTGVDLSLPPSGSISGTAIDETGESVAQLWVVAARQSFRNGRRELVSAARTVTNDIGQFRLAALGPGEYYLVFRQRDVRMGPFADEPIAFGTTFYSGATSIDMAQAIRVRLGERVANILVPVVSAPTATVGGRVVDESGRPVPMTQVSVTDGADVVPNHGLIGGGRSDADGRFTIKGLPPGGYTLVARQADARGELDVHVTGANILDLTMTLGRGARVRGRMVSASGRPLPPLAALQPRAVAAGGRGLGGAPPRIQADGSFEWVGLLGAQLLRTAPLPSGWWLKEVRRGDADITDTPILFAHGDVIEDVQFVLDDRPTEVSGRVRNPDGGAVSDYTVLLFSSDEAQWTPESRRIHADRPDHTGLFRVQGLPPGEYLAVAVDFVETGRWLDRAYLSSLRGSAIPVTVAPEEKVELKLTLSGGR